MAQRRAGCNEGLRSGAEYCRVLPEHWLILPTLYQAMSTDAPAMREQCDARTQQAERHSACRSDTKQVRGAVCLQRNVLRPLGLRHPVPAIGFEQPPRRGPRATRVLRTRPLGKNPRGTTGYFNRNRGPQDSRITARRYYTELLPTDSASPPRSSWERVGWRVRAGPGLLPLPYRPGPAWPDIVRARLLT